MSGQDLAGRDFKKANLNNANLKNTIFIGARTNGANLSKVKKANFHGALP